MKKINQKGFTHHLVMFAVLALVLGAMGFAGYRVYQNRNIDARAANYKTVAQGNNVALRACKRNTTSVNIYAQNFSGSTVYFIGSAVRAHSNSVTKIMTQGGGASISTVGSGWGKTLLYWMVNVNVLPLC